MTKKIFPWLAILFVLTVWVYFLVSPNPKTNTILVQKQTLGVKIDESSFFIDQPILAEQLTTFFEPKPKPLQRSAKVKTITKDKFYSFLIKDKLVGVLLSALTAQELTDLNKSTHSTNFDLLFTNTSQIPPQIKAQIPTIYISNRPPSKSLQTLFRTKNQALVWTKDKILIDGNSEALEIFE